MSGSVRVFLWGCGLGFAMFNSHQCGRAVDSMNSPACSITVVDRTIPNREVTMTVVAGTGELERAGDCDPVELYRKALEWREE